MDDIDTSQYYVIRKGEYDDLQAEIERLRAVVARQGMRLLIAHTEALGLYDDG